MIGGLYLQCGFLAYYVFGIVLLVVNLKGVAALPWNQNRNCQSFSKKVVVDALENVFWPYTFWRVYKIRRNSR